MRGCPIGSGPVMASIPSACRSGRSRCGDGGRGRHRSYDASLSFSVSFARQSVGVPPADDDTEPGDAPFAFILVGLVVIEASHQAHAIATLSAGESRSPGAWSETVGKQVRYRRMSRVRRSKTANAAWALIDEVGQRRRRPPRARRWTRLPNRVFGQDVQDQVAVYQRAVRHVSYRL